MLTFEKVLTVFEAYLNEDKRYEILTTSHGYTVMEWDSMQQEWADAQACSTPERMKEILLDAYACYLEYQITSCNRPLTDKERLSIRNQLAEMSNLL